MSRTSANNHGLRPTGPKAMRGDRQAGRGRMLNQINRALDRNSDSALHRVRGQHGRINSHGRDHTRGRPHQNGGGRRQMNNRSIMPRCRFGYSPVCSRIQNVPRNRSLNERKQEDFLLERVLPFNHSVVCHSLAFRISLLREIFIGLWEALI